MSTGRSGYDDAIVTVPVTVPYERYSLHGAHWFVARALTGLLEGSGLTKSDIDGLCLSSFTLTPDTAVGLTQHLGLSLRWLDHIPMGGAAGIVALRRALRAVQSGDATVVACVGADTNHLDSFRATLGSFSQFARDAVYPYGAGGPNASFAFLTAHYMRVFGARREDFGKLCVAQRDNALKFPHALFKKPLTLQEYLDARPIAEPLHLFDCVMPCAGSERSAWACALQPCSARSSVTTPFPMIPSRCAAAGCSIAMSCLRRPESPASRSISCRLTMTIR
jgi:acetyl-CoA acetyltransferase